MIPHDTPFWDDATWPPTIFYNLQQSTVHKKCTYLASFMKLWPGKPLKQAWKLCGLIRPEMFHHAINWLQPSIVYSMLKLVGQNTLIMTNSKWPQRGTHPSAPWPGRQRALHHLVARVLVPGRAREQVRATEHEQHRSYIYIYFFYHIYIYKYYIKIFF